MAYLEGSSPSEKLKKAYIPGMTNNFLLWPWVQAVNFKYVPLEHRVFVVNVVALGEFPFPARFSSRRVHDRAIGRLTGGQVGTATSAT